MGRAPPVDPELALRPARLALGREHRKSPAPLFDVGLGPPLVRTAGSGARRSLAVARVRPLRLDRALEVVVGNERDRHVAGLGGGQHGSL